MKEIPVGAVILDVQGLSLTSEEQEILTHPNVGGVIFFSRNYESREQITDLAQHIKLIRPNCLICVDQEGGRVQRFIKDFTRLPHMRTLGELVSSSFYSMAEILDICEKLGQLMALEVRSVGVDLSFAPVLDLDKGISDVMKDRAIHEHPDIVSTLASAYMKGMAKAGMKATGKHFPGHGSVKADSHHALPEDLRPFDEVAPDMAPFTYLIHQGLTGIMPAHIVYPKIDPYPVGFSNFWLREILRDQIGFQGTIVSDDLSMEGAKDIGDYPMRALKAQEAGCDYMLVCNNREGAISVLETLPPNYDELTQQRRLNLFAQGAAPSWHLLTQSLLWQEAHKALLQLQQVQVQSCETL